MSKPFPSFQKKDREEEKPDIWCVGPSNGLPVSVQNLPSDL